jgi:hypothetical protein
MEHRRRSVDPAAVLVVFLILLAALAVGCGGENLTVQPATDADTAGLPEEERNYVSCLRKAGIKVRVPSSVRKLATEEGGLNLFFYSFDKREPATKEQVAAARECEKIRGSAGKASPPAPARRPDPSGPGRYMEASTPGSGGFIETPQSLSTKAVPGRFEGAERRVYAQAEHVCGQLPKRVVRSMTALNLPDLHSRLFPKAWRQAALEGCRAGLRS